MFFHSSSLTWHPLSRFFRGQGKKNACSADNILTLSAATISNFFRGRILSVWGRTAPYGAAIFPRSRIFGRCDSCMSKRENLGSRCRKSSSQMTPHRSLGSCRRWGYRGGRLYGAVGRAHYYKTSKLLSSFCYISSPV